MMKKRQLFRILITIILLCALLCFLSWYRSKDLPPSISFQQEYAQEGMPLTISCQHYPAGTQFTYTWQIGDTVIAHSSDSYTPTHDDLGKFITVTVTSDDGTAPQSLTMFFSTLPVFYIDTSDGSSIYSKDFYFDATIHMQGNDRYNKKNTALYNGAFQIKGRGNSTWRTEKLSYRFKLQQNTDLMGLGANKHWILHANPFDDSLMRNKIAYDLSGAMGMPYMESTWVDVILNGEYLGNYQLCEQIRVGDNRIEITDWESCASDITKILVETGTIPASEKDAIKDHLIWNMGWLTSGIIQYNDRIIDISSFFSLPEINGGLLFELDAFYDEPTKFMIENQPIQIRHPKYIGTNDDVMTYAYEFVDAFYNASYFSEDFYTIYQDSATHYSQLFDIDSLALYFVLNEIFFNEDAGLKSTYFYKEVNELAHMGPIWDMDYSSGGQGHQSYIYDQWWSVFYNNYSQADQWYKGLIRDPYFLSKALEIWNTHRDMILHLIDDDGPIEEAYDYIYDAAIYNFYVWPDDSSLPLDHPKNQRFQNGYAIYKDWMTNHLHWLDEQFTTLEALVSSVGAFDGGNGVSLSKEGDHVTVNALQGNLAKFYYNGILQAEIPLSDGMATWNIPSSLYNSTSDVIQVRVYENESQIGSDYVDFR